jgi:hypothetical protein
MRQGEAMHQPSPRLMLCVVVMVGLSSARAPADAEDAFPVVVLVDDRASAAPSVLDQAGKEVVRIYRHAGMRVVWRKKTTPSSPASPEDRRAFTVYLMVRAGLLPKSDRPSQFLMGAAPGGAIDCGGVAFLFFDQAIEFSRVHQTAAALVMGTVVAHEIGHLLLKNRGHTSEGLMRAPWSAGDWERASSGILLFSQPESETMRATVGSCR